MTLNQASLIQILIENIKGVDVSNIEPEANFKDVGLDSLDQATFLMSIDEQLGINIPDEDIDKCYSISSTLSYLQAIQETV